MKTTWNYSYLEKRMPARDIPEWMRVTARRMELRTGAPWHGVTLAGKVSFRPYMPRDQQPDDSEHKANVVLLALLKAGKALGWGALSWEAKLELRETMAVGQHLFRFHLAQPEVDRLGKVSGIALSDHGRERARELLATLRARP